MRDLEHEYNFNDPIELTEIFRTKPEDEYGGRVTVNWEDIKLIKEYPYKDDWTTFKGDKFYLSLHNYPNDILILGSYSLMTKQYRDFRNEFPLFRHDD